MVALDYGRLDQLIGLAGRVFANGPGDLGSIPGWVIPTQHYKVCIKDKVEQSRGKSSTLPYTSM